MPKLLLAQAKPILLDKEKNMKTMEGYLKEASRQKVDLVLFPELFLTGYFTRDKTRILAEDLNGPSISHLRELARNYQVKTIFGFPELKEGKVYNSSCFIDEYGDILGTYQKVHLWDEESKYFDPGDTFKVFDTSIGKIGIMICYDSEFPESARILALKGAEIILTPTASMTPFQPTQSIFVQSRAAENQVFTATTNRIGSEEETTFFGESAAADPYGRLLGKCGNGEEALIVEVDLRLIREAKSFHNYLDDRRPIYKYE